MRIAVRQQGLYPAFDIRLYSNSDTSSKEIVKSAFQNYRNVTVNLTLVKAC